MNNIELNDQQRDFLKSYLESELEREQYLSQTTKVIFQQIINKLEEQNEINL
jgi:NADPH-dependent 7-cyano-7-deazaguanine reductase QueF